MNEQIRAISELVKWNMHESDDLDTFIEQFAELIVKECAQISISVDETMTGQGHASAQAFMEHFGVE